MNQGASGHFIFVTGEKLRGVSLEITDEIRESHAVLSAYNVDFLDYVRKNPQCLERSSFSALDHRNDLVQFPLQSWPTFVGHEFQHEISRAAVGITRLIKCIPERFFGSDPVKLASYYLLEDHHSSILVELLNLREHVDGLINRHDFVYGATGFKCLECNMTSYLGGWNAGIFAQWYGEIPVLQPFFSALSHELTYADIPRNFFRHMFQRAQGRLPIGNEFNVAFVIPQKERPEHTAVDFARSKIQEIANRGGPHIEASVGTCDYADFQADARGLFLNGKRINVVVENQNGFVSREIFRNLFMGSIDVYNGPLTVIYNDKRNLALLSEAQNSDLLTAEEQDFVREFIPWTRELKSGRSEFDGERIDLVEFVESHRERLVLKPARSAHGERVHIGSKMGPAAWLSVLEQALQADDSWIVQELVESLPFLFQNGRSGASPHDMVWGFFVFGDQYGGTLLRMLPKEGSGIVNAAQGAMEGALIEVQEP